MEMRFDGKLALVTGGGRGLGSTIALALAQAGADVFIVDILENEARLACEKIRAMGRSAEYMTLDVSDSAQVERLANAIPKLDIMVHSAGIVLNSPLIDAAQADIKRLFDVNILGSNNIVQMTLKKMIPRKSGKIVLISSVGGKIPSADQAHYRMSKAAVIMLAQSAAHTAAPHNINVNAVCPGIIRTPMWEKILDERSAQSGKPREEIWDGFIKGLVPLGRAQSEQDIANAVAFLCSDLAQNITGQALNVCGGRCM